MSEISTIPKEISAEYGKDYAFLHDAGMNYIEKLASKLWTDYNVHDPGVTILDMLCYAITDLGYRISVPVEDLLTSPKDNLRNMHEQFQSAINALPSCPVNANDYRRMFVRIEGVKNAWITASKRLVYAKFDHLVKEGVPELHYNIDRSDEPFIESFTLQGLNNILIDFDESVALDKKDVIINSVKAVYSRYRNLCEDIDSISEVPMEDVLICGDIDILPNADPEQVWAQIVFNIDQYLSPDIPFYSLQEMLESGKKPDEIFEGPVFDFNDNYAFFTPGNPILKKGFIRNEDLVESELRKEVRLSDIIRIIMNTDGVKLVKEIAFGLCGCDEKDMIKVRKAVTADKWNLCITSGYKPVFCRKNSVLNFWKDLIPIELKKDEALLKLYDLRKKRNEEMQTKITEDIPMPEGKFREIENYRTFQNQFPENYGIGQAGLPDSATIIRKSQAKQLKAYLLFFEQVLANYFAQLSHVSTLFSADNSIVKTYFANVVKGIKDEDQIFDDIPDWRNEIDLIHKSTGLDNYTTRKNRFLDHLLARFAEQFNEYVFLMHRLYAADSDRAIIRHKVNFLQKYPEFSASRGKGFDYYNPKTSDERLAAVSGMEKRISYMLGFNNYLHTSLANLSYSIDQSGTLKMMIKGKEQDVPCYGWSILKEGKIILESKNKEFLRRNDAYEEMGLGTLLGCEREYYDISLSPDKTKAGFSLHDTKGNTIAANPSEYDTITDETETKIAEIIKFLSNDFKLEGLYVVEHILLRPDFEDDDQEHFLPVCIDKNHNYCKPLDPYSFRLTVVLPGYSMRLRNKYFREFAERLIRMEMPAHVLPRICFIGQDQMEEFEAGYKNWIEACLNSSDPLRQPDGDILLNLLNVMGKLYTIYDEGRLTDCDDDTPDKNPIVLGRSRLGTGHGTGSEDKLPEK